MEGGMSFDGGGFQKKHRMGGDTPSMPPPLGETLSDRQMEKSDI